jgi:hypothetical protein
LIEVFLIFKPEKKDEAKIIKYDKQKTKPQHSSTSTSSKSRESNSLNRSKNQPLEGKNSRTIRTDVMKPAIQDKLVTKCDLSKEKQRSVRSRSIPEKVKQHVWNSSKKRRASSPGRGSAAKKRADSKHHSSKDTQFRKTSRDKKQPLPTFKVKTRLFYFKDLLPSASFAARFTNSFSLKFVLLCFLNLS